MHDEILRIRERVENLTGAIDQFSAGSREQLFESRDMLRELTDEVGQSPWSHVAPICEAVKKLLGNTLRHGGLTELDAAELARDLLEHVGRLLDLPAPGISSSQPRIVHGPGAASQTTRSGAEFTPKGEPIKVSLGMVDESRLGEILVRRGRIDSSQLNQALALQQLCRKRLGEVLISMEAIDESMLELALEEQRRLTVQMANDLASGRGGLELKLGAEPERRTG